MQEPYAFQWLLWRGLDHGEDRARFEREDPDAARNHRHLNKRLSLSDVTQDGDKAACCVWFHPDTEYACVEPL